jgi:hypothetical protein
MNIENMESEDGNKNEKSKLLATIESEGKLLKEKTSTVVGAFLKFIARGK